MNILFIIDHLSGGGAERVCSSVANGLVKLGHNVVILTKAVSDKDYSLDNRIKVIKFDLPGGGMKGRFKRITFFISVLKNNHIDVAINILGFWFSQTILLCRLMGVKIVFSDHNPYERPANAQFPFSKEQFKIKFKLSRHCDCTTVLTRRDKVILGKRKNVVVMPNPLFLPILKEVPAKENVILAVGRFHVWEVKGFDILIKAWGNICKDYPSWSLKIIGDGTSEERSVIDSFIHESNAERVLIEPFRKNISEEYQKASVFVLSSRYEGFGLVLIEAMSQRCACVACDYKTRQADIITDGVDGLLCRTDDVDDLTLKMNKILSDSILRNSIQLHSADKLEQYQESVIAEKWNSLLNSLIQ